MYEGDKGCLQLQSFIAAEHGRCGLWWWEDTCDEKDKFVRTNARFIHHKSFTDLFQPLAHAAKVIFSNM